VPLTEARLVLIIGAFIWLDVLVSRQRLRRVAAVFALACVTGWLAQLALGPAMNLYTPNVSLYVAYVSVGIIFAWGVALTSMWALYIALCRVTGWRPNAVLYILSGLPAMLILEYIGSNVLVMRLHDFHRYQPLMPITNSMRAPVWLYVYYTLVGLLFYGLLAVLRMNAGDWSPMWGMRPRAAVPDPPAAELRLPCSVGPVRDVSEYP
jgi:hypothetical protein